MQLSLQKMLLAVLREAYRLRIIVLLLFVLISLGLLALGFVWPLEYQSTGSVLVDRQSILAPLIEGTAETNNRNGIDQSHLAREIILSNRSMDRVIQAAELDPGDRLTAVERENLRDRLKGNTTVRRVGPNVIRITHINQDPDVAHIVVKNFIDIFMEESFEAKLKESRDAYTFIDNQAKSYLSKLQFAEQRLKEFRSENVDAIPGTENTITGRILELQRRVEQTRLELQEMEILETELEKQLSGEAQINTQQSRQSQNQERILALQQQLDALRLRFHDTYPDIVSLKDQIRQLRQEASSGRTDDEDEYNTDQNASNPLYQQLRSDISSTRTQIAALKSRLRETKLLLDDEIERSKRLNAVTATLSELTRDYEVNQDIYQNLLRQRERALVSMNIDIEQQGLTLSIQEEATKPVTPDGPRLMHFAMAGLLLGAILPIGLVYVLVFLDTRIRDESQLAQVATVPVLGAIPHMSTPAEMRVKIIWYLFMFLCFSAVLGIYGYVGYVRLSGVGHL